MAFATCSTPHTHIREKNHAPHSITDSCQQSSPPLMSVVPTSERVHILERNGPQIPINSPQVDMNAIERLLPLERTLMLAMLLPKLIPEAVEGDEIWGIGHIDPKTFVMMNCTEDKLEDWENIDPMFN